MDLTKKSNILIPKTFMVKMIEKMITEQINMIEN